MHCNGPLTQVPTSAKTSTRWKLHLSWTCFHHGLLRLKLDMHSISPVSAGVPSWTLGLFKLSSHPALTGSNFPCPEEWIFEEGERVIVSSEKEATIAAVESTHLEVDFATNEGIKRVSWYNVRKVFSPGDFVIVMSGPSRGTKGWVERLEDDTVYFLEYKEEGNVSSSFDDSMVSFILPVLRWYMLIQWFVLQRYEFHINWLKLTTVPFFHTSSTLKMDDSLSKADRVPWISTNVIITKLGSSFKGYVAVVKDVLPGQDTASSLKIEIQLTYLDPASPFRRTIVDYDDVVEKMWVNDLHLHAQYLISLLEGRDTHFMTMHSLKAFFSNLPRPIWSQHAGLSHLSLGCQLLMVPLQCLTRPLRLLEIHCLALHGILKLSFLIWFTKTYCLQNL